MCISEPIDDQYNVFFAHFWKEAKKTLAVLTYI